MHNNPEGSVMAAKIPTSKVPKKQSATPVQCPTYETPTAKMPSRMRG